MLHLVFGWAGFCADRLAGINNFKNFPERPRDVRVCSSAAGSIASAEQMVLSCSKIRWPDAKRDRRAGTHNYSQVNQTSRFDRGYSDWPENP
jgi:hypothetical protein